MTTPSVHSRHPGSQFGRNRPKPRSWKEKLGSTFSLATAIWAFAVRTRKCPPGAARNSTSPAPHRRSHLAARVPRPRPYPHPPCPSLRGCPEDARTGLDSHLAKLPESDRPAADGRRLGRSHMRNRKSCRMNASWICDQAMLRRRLVFRTIWNHKIAWTRAGSSAWPTAT